jgi:ferredoxin
MGVEIKFEVENQPERSGIVAEGSYLWDAAKRHGIHLKAVCGGRGECDTCAVMVKEGVDILSEPTNAEITILGEERRAGGERLACQTRIERSGELLIMVRESVEEEKEELNFRKDFSELPLDKKFSTLVEIEAVALGEAVNFIANLPYAIVGQGVSLLAMFGLQMDKRKETENRPPEHKAEAEAE